MSNPLAAATDPNSNSFRLAHEMAENSDTDSDSQSSILANAEDIPYPGPTFSSSPDSPEPGSISQIIQTLLHQPLTSFRYEEMETASSTLVRFIDDIPSRLKNDDVVDVLATFALLGMSITLVAKKEIQPVPYSETDILKQIIRISIILPGCCLSNQRKVLTLDARYLG